MNLDSLQKYCLEKKGVTEGFPFDDETLVFKVGGKMFCLVNLTPPQSVNLKCNPEKAIELREEYEEILPGYHMNKKHWNTIVLDRSIPQDLLLTMIADSYTLVVKGLKRGERNMLERV